MNLLVVIPVKLSVTSITHVESMPSTGILNIERHTSMSASYSDTVISVSLNVTVASACKKKGGLLAS